MVNLNEHSFKNTSTWEYGDMQYEVLTYEEKTRKVFIRATNISSIYYFDYTSETITRKLSKDNTIKLENFRHDMTKVFNF